MLRLTGREWTEWRHRGQGEGREGDEAAVEAQGRRPPGTLVAGDDLSVLITDEAKQKLGNAVLLSRRMTHRS